MKRLLSVLVCLAVCFFATGVHSTALGDRNTIEKDEVLAALYDADLWELRLALDSGLITSVELTEYYLNRIEAYNTDYNCFITMCDDALEVARSRDEELKNGGAEGLLFGIPVVVKDNMDVEGYLTTNGNKKSASQLAFSNADVVERLLSEGAVIVAKTNMSTAAQDARASHSEAAGETKNAYSTYMASGGSSGGTAVATSLNFTAAGLGTDTNSSLRIPAALAGCVALRPTFGKISLSGIKKLNSTRDTVGAITRSVGDQALMLDVLTEGAYSYYDQLDSDALKGMRIGVLKELSYAAKGERKQENIDPEVAEAFNMAVQELRACGAEVVEVSMPNLFDLSDTTFDTNSKASKDALYAEFERLLEGENVEAVVYPTYLSTPLRSGVDGQGKNWDVYSQVFINNCRALSPSASLPEITVPIGVHPLGAGIGMEIASAKDSEQLLLNIAYSYTKSYDHRMTPEGAPNDYSAYYTGTIEELIERRDRPPQSDEDEQTSALPKADNQLRQWHIVEYTLLGVAAVSVLAATVLTVVLIVLRVKERRKRSK